ncbi:unnamed protein product, partial [Ectocarpus sp. 12 AP-2014]
ATRAGASRLRRAADAGSDGSGAEGQGESLRDIQSRLQQVDTLSAKIDTAMMAAEDRLPAVGGMALTRDVDCRRRRVPTARLQQHLTDVQRHSRQRGVRKSDPRPPEDQQNHAATAAALAAGASAAPAAPHPSATRSGERKSGDGGGRQGGGGRNSEGGAGSSSRKRKVPENGTVGAAAGNGGRVNANPPSGSGSSSSISSGIASSKTTAAAQAGARRINGTQHDQ